jgi:hypothetical protein
MKEVIKYGLIALGVLLLWRFVSGSLASNSIGGSYDIGSTYGTTYPYGYVQMVPTMMSSSWGYSARPRGGPTKRSGNGLRASY